MRTRTARALARGALSVALGATLGVSSSREAAADPSSTTPEQGYDLGEIQSPRAVAMGGAQNALGTSTTALYLNPANLPFARVYHFEGLAAIGTQARRQSYGGAVVDSITSRLAGGFGGTWSQMDPDGIRRTWTDLRLGLAYPLGDRFSVGAAGRYLRASQLPSRGPLGASLASDGTPKDALLNELTFDVGATAALTDNLRLGAVGKNLTSTGSALAPTTLGGGLGFQSREFAVEVDGLADFTTWGSTKARIMAGAEVFLADRFAIRGGYRYDDGQKAHAATGGLGYIDRRWSVEVSGRHDVSAKFPNTLFSIGLRYFYDAAKVSPDEGDF